MKKVLEDLWYGNISPHEEGVSDIPRMKELMHTLNDIHKELYACLPKEACALFEKYADTYTEMMSLCECRDFARGFSLGVKLVFASFLE